MANQRIQMFQVKRIIELRASKKSNRFIARILGISRNTLDSYLKQLSSHNPDLSTFLLWTEEQLDKLLNPVIVEVPASHRELYTLYPGYVKELTHVGVSRMTLWTEYCLKHPTGTGYRHFYNLFRQWQASQKVTMHIEHKAGDKLFVDFAGDKLHLTDIETGQQISVEFFVAILPCSQITYAQCVMSQRKEDRTGDPVYPGPK